MLARSLRRRSCDYDPVSSVEGGFQITNVERQPDQSREVYFIKTAKRVDEVPGREFHQQASCQRAGQEGINHRDGELWSSGAVQFWDLHGPHGISGCFDARTIISSDEL